LPETLKYCHCLLPLTQLMQKTSHAMGHVF
jgi:hypothetical protein